MKLPICFLFIGLSTLVQADILGHYLIGDSGKTIINWAQLQGLPNYTTSSWQFDGGSGSNNANILDQVTLGSTLYDFPTGTINYYDYSYLSDPFYQDAGMWQTWSNADINDPSTTIVNSYANFTPEAGYAISFTTLTFQWGAILGPGGLDANVSLGYTIYTRSGTGGWEEHSALRNESAATLTTSSSSGTHLFSDVSIDLSSLGLITGSTDIMIAFLDNYNGNAEGNLISRNFVFEGEVISIPEPATTLLVGGVLFLPFIRRKGKN